MSAPVLFDIFSCKFIQIVCLLSHYKVFVVIDSMIEYMALHLAEMHALTLDYVNYDSKEVLEIRQMYVIYGSCNNRSTNILPRRITISCQMLV